MKKNIVCPYCGEVVGIGQEGIMVFKGLEVDENGKLDESNCYSDEFYYDGKFVVDCFKCKIEEKFDDLQDFLDNGFTKKPKKGGE